MQAARTWAALIGAIVFLLAAGVVAGGSLQFAYDAGASLTETENSLMSVAWMLAALDAAKLGALVALSFFIRRRTWLPVTFASAAIIVGVLFSLYGSYRAQINAYARADAIESKGKTDVETLNKGIAELEKQLALPDYVNVPTQEVVHQQMARYKINPKFSASNGCTMVPSPQGSVKFCEEYAALLSKVAAAGDADRMREKLGELRAKKVSHDVVMVANPEVKNIAEMFGVDMSTAYAIRSTVFALGYEIASGAALPVAVEYMIIAFGFAGVRLGDTSEPSQKSSEVSHSETSEKSSDVATSKSSEKPTDTHPPKGGVRKPSETPAKTGRSEGPRLTLVKPSETSVAEYLKTVAAAPGSEHRFGGLKEGYLGWCLSEGVMPVADNKLGPAIEAAGFEKKKGIGGLMVYFDRRRAVAETA